MRPQRLHIAFLLCALASAWFLRSAPFDESRVALSRLDSLLRLQPGMKDEISRRCTSLTPKAGSEIEAFFAERLSPMAGRSSGAACRLEIQSAHSQRFHLRSFWSFVLRVSGNGSIYDRSFTVEFPRPLCFLPVCLFVLALLFRLSVWGLGWTVGTYLFGLAGFSFLRTLSLTAHAGLLTATSDPTLPGLLLIALWLAMYRHREERPGAHRHELVDHTIRHLATFLIGLWNPLVYSIAGRALFPLRGTLSRLKPFLDTQLLFACLSLSLLSLDFSRGLEGIQHAVLLPRYFSCATLIFLVFQYTMLNLEATPLALELPPFWRGLFMVLTVELVATAVPWLREHPRLVRIGFALVLSELPWLRYRQLLATLKTFTPWAVAIFLASFSNVVSQTAGATDLALALLNPQAQAESLVFTTFLAGLGIGFLTGSVSISFFALFPAVLPGHEPAMVKAALLDGILAGNLLSPFSLFNLLPAAQFQMSLERLVLFRFQQLLPALLIGGAIYAVSSLNSIAILQPVTFVFLVLVAVAFQLSKSSWRMERFNHTL